MVSPVVHLMVLYFHALINSTSYEVKLSRYVSLLLDLYDPYDILNMFTCLLYKYLTRESLKLWIVIANCLKDYIDGGKDLPTYDTWFLGVSRFLAYPFSAFSLVTQGKLEVVEIIEPWKSVYEFSQCSESLLPVFDWFLEDYSKVDRTQKTNCREFLSFCGDAVTCVLERILKSSESCRNKDDGDRTRFISIKTSLQCAGRFLSVSYEEAKENGQILDSTSRVFSALVRIMESFQSSEDIFPIVEIISIPLLQWLLDCDLQHNNTIYQLNRLWITMLKRLHTGWPPINFNSTFLKLQATILEATLDHRNPSISDPTIAFWNCTYGKQIKLDHPENLLPILDKLSRTGKINLGKKRFSRIEASRSPPKTHKVTTTLNRCVKRVELMDDHMNGSGLKRKRLELTERQKEVRRAQQGRLKDCEGRGPGVRTYTSVDFSQGNEEETQEESQDLRNVESILEMLKRDV